MDNQDRIRDTSPTTPQVKPVIIGGNRKKTPISTTIEIEEDTKEMIEPEKKRPTRGRPPKRNTEIQVQPERSLTELTEQEASQLDYDTWINEFPWETGQYTMKLRRQHPAQLQIGAKRVDIAGLIHEQNAPLSEGEITERFGGKTWQIMVVGPDPRTGKHRALRNKQLIVPGEPRLSAESLPHNMWLDVRPLLIEAGKIKEDEDLDESFEDDLPASARHYRVPLGYGNNTPSMYYPQQRPQRNEVDKFSVDALDKAFRSATTMAKDTTVAALKEKERLFENQNRIFTDQEKRAKEELMRIEREREKAIEKAELIREQNEKDKRIHEQQLESVKNEANQRLEDERRRAQTENAQAVSTGLDLFKTIFPSQTASAQEAQNNLIRMFENRIASAEVGHQNALQAERALAQANIVALQSMYQGQLDTTREQARTAQEQNKIYIDRIEALRDQIQVILQQKAIEASSTNRTSELVETMTMLNQLKEAVSSGNAGNPDEPNLSTAGGMLARVMQTVENVAPSVAHAMAARNANSFSMNTPQPVQETAIVPVVPVPEMPPVTPNPNPKLQTQKPPTIKLKKEDIAKQLNQLATIFNEQEPPTENIIDNIARGINATQSDALLDVIAKAPEDALITSFDRNGLIPETLKTEKGLAFLTATVKKVKFYRQSV